MKVKNSLMLVIFCLWFSGSATASPLEDLGSQLFFDTNLSSPPGQACASCHAVDSRFTDPRRDKPTSPGILSGRFGNRNAPTAMYARFSPSFYFDAAQGLYIGGQFLDGRAADLETQAQGPFLNLLEMANPDKVTVVEKVRNAAYADLFRQVFGADALDDTEQAYYKISQAIAAFERTSTFAPFSSKYDAYLKGQVGLTSAEKRGLELFENSAKGNCAACHPSQPSKDGTPPLFTDFTYDNLGGPRNPNNPFYTLPVDLNPEGYNFVDLGLGKAVNSVQEDGKFKVPTLRNIALTAPYTHNGYFSSLKAVVDFYNTRDTKAPCPNPFTNETLALQSGCWPVAEVGTTVNHGELGNLGLSDGDVDDLVAFLNTLTDGYVVPTPVENTLAINGTSAASVASAVQAASQVATAQVAMTQASLLARYYSTLSTAFYNPYAQFSPYQFQMNQAAAVSSLYPSFYTNAYFGQYSAMNMYSLQYSAMNLYSLQYSALNMYTMRYSAFNLFSSQNAALNWYYLLGR